MRWLRRLRNVSLMVAVPTIAFGPIVMAAWEVREARRETDRARASAAARDDATAAGYLSRRNAVIDRLLPEGAGGTSFSENLTGRAGEANVGAASITLKATFLSQPWPESVELHERAHLLFAFAPREAAAVLADLPAPAADEYAATDRGEHFAEMAALAWEVVAPQDGFCALLGPVDALREAEARVPGTAGFVEWFLREPSLGNTESRAELETLAASFTQPRRAAWDALWRSVEQQRRADRTFEAWRHAGIRGSIEARRATALGAGGFWDTMDAALLTPSLAVLALFGR